VILLRKNPKLAVRDCGHCQKYLYDETKGEPVKSAGQLVERYSGKFAPCRYPALGCEKGTPEDSKTLNERNTRAYLHWRKCKATGIFPDDPIVAHNAVLIQGVFDAEEKDFRETMKALLMALGGLGNGRR
jgi:hypothetical protein